MDNNSIKKLETDLWEAAFCSCDTHTVGSKEWKQKF